jgi:hypothetical protein
VRSCGGLGNIDELLEETQRFDGIEVLAFHGEGDQITAALAAVAAPDALIGVDGKGGCTFLVKGTEPPPLTTTLAQRHAKGLNRLRNVSAAHGIKPLSEIIGLVHARKGMRAASTQAPLGLLDHLAKLELDIGNAVAGVGSSNSEKSLA